MSLWTRISLALLGVTLAFCAVRYTAPQGVLLPGFDQLEAAEDLERVERALSVQEIGSQVRVRSAGPGHGATFEIELSGHPQDEAAGAQPSLAA